MLMVCRLDTSELRQAKSAKESNTVNQSDGAKVVFVVEDESEVSDQQLISGECLSQSNMCMQH